MLNESNLFRLVLVFRLSTCFVLAGGSWCCVDMDWCVVWNWIEGMFFKSQSCLEFLLRRILFSSLLKALISFVSSGTACSFGSGWALIAVVWWGRSWKYLAFKVD